MLFNVTMSRPGTNVKPGSQEIIDHSMELIIIVLIKFIADMIFIKVWSSLGEFFYNLS